MPLFDSQVTTMAQHEKAILVFLNALSVALFEAKGGAIHISMATAQQVI